MRYSECGVGWFGAYIVGRKLLPDEASGQLHRLYDLFVPRESLESSCRNPKDLIGKNAYQLHDELCRITGEKHDPCVIDVFLAVIDFMEGGNPVPW
jgi:hypothetical protein